MATALQVPKHITRPFGARDLVASHPVLDMSAWIMANRSEVLAFRGQVVDDTFQSKDNKAHRPRDEVFGYRRLANQRVIAYIQCMYNVNLDPRTK